jgi:HlyD family secretion protein
MFITGWLKAAWVLLVMRTAASGVELFAQQGSAVIKAPPQVNPQAARADFGPVHEVKPRKLRFEVIERGCLEPSRAQESKSQVEGRTSVISLRPDGSEVKKGQLICELDSSASKDKLVNQSITTRSAEAAYQQAKLAREIADIALREYTEGILKQERLTLQTTIVSAATAVHKASGRLERTRNVQQRVQNALAAKGGNASPADMAAELLIEDLIDSTEKTLERETTALEQAKAKREVLEKYTSMKISAELKGEVEHKRSDELARSAAWRLAKSKEGHLRQQIENCSIYAAFDGYIVLADEPKQNGDPKIEVGSSVRQGQRIFNLLDLTAPLRLNAKVHESHLNLIAPGQRARIVVDALPDQKMTGIVKRVAELPDATNFFEPKVYSAWVEIDIRSPHLRPGMAAHVEILVPELENVLSVPCKAMLYFDEKYHLAVKKPDGGFEWREVEIGQADETTAVIKQGLKSGEVVALNPLALMSEEEKRQKFGSPPDEK